MRKQQTGFTLIELMIAVAIIGVLAAIAYPSYLDYVMDARRADIQSEMLFHSQRMEREYTVNGSYVGASTALPTYEYYTLNAAVTQSTFTITAAPKDSQVDDTCGNLSINHIGVKAASGGSASCW